MIRLRHVRTSCSLIAMATSALGSIAHAQTVPDPSVAVGASAQGPSPVAAEEEPAQEAADIVVTGSRIALNGYSQPTPTTTLSAADLERTAQPNLFTAVAQLPSLQGSTGRSVQTFSTSSGLQGLSSFSLRGLGAIRTLTLIDGERVVGANVTGVTDISQFPQLLVKRVDVVTGGASASYGSDAVGGVVNFITDTRFKGFKANVEGGITNYGDDENVTVQAAWGGSALDDRLHLQASGEYGYEAGVPGGGYGIDSGPNGRSWFSSPVFETRPIAQTNDGRPQLRLITQTQQFLFAKYGLITNGPLQGTGFGVGGAPYQFQYGSNGRPTGTGAVTGCVTPYCIGGDLSGVITNGTSLASRLERAVGYGRIGFDLDADNEVYATVNLARVSSSNQPNLGAIKSGNLTIQCSNPFVPLSVQTACAANNITSFQFGTANASFPRNISVHPRREQQRYVLGAKGKVDFLGKALTYNAYYQHGVNHTNLRVDDISLTPRYNAAIDAVLDASGNIVCRSLAARNSGCQPLNVIGDVTPSTGALAYVIPTNGPRQRTRQTQDVVSFNVSAEPFSLWAGPVAFATGAEYRREWYRVRADPYGNGVYPDSPNTVEYPADPLLNTVTGNNWFAGNYHNGGGSYEVKEAYLETNVPLLNGQGTGRVNLNMAGRVTDYSTSGKVYAWKVGGTWDTPLDGIRLRAVTSRDVRAPNLSELFAAPVVSNNAVNNNGTIVTIQQQVVGNTNLRPETARNTTFGATLVNPSWLPGLGVSFDYYDIKVKGVISTLSAQQQVDLCNAGNQELCGSLLLNSPLPNANFVRVQAFNLASVSTHGFDAEVSYRTDLGSVGMPGRLTTRLLATRVISFKTESGVLGTIPVESAGVNQGQTPKWKLLATESWGTDRFDLTLFQRWFSNGVYSNEAIECQTDCPVSTVQRPTIFDNHLKGAFYLDVGGSYNLTKGINAYFKVDNVFDKSPEPAPGGGVGQGVNPFLYDVLGRIYRVGVRMNF